MPSNLDRALRGLKARRVLRDLMAAKSEYPSEFATRLIKDTCKEYRMNNERHTIHMFLFVFTPLLKELDKAILTHPSLERKRKEKSK